MINPQIVDGFGVFFNPDTHWSYVKVALDKYERERREPQPPSVEPVWKDAPAGRSKCPAVHEDHEQGKGHYA